MGAARSVSRRNSSFGQDPQNNLRAAFRNNEKITFCRLLNSNSINIDFCFDYPDYKTCLELAASKPNKIYFLKELLRHKADVNTVNELHNSTPLNFAVESANIEAVKALLQDERIEVNILSKSNTALLRAIKNIEDIDEDRERSIKLHEEIIEHLLKAGVNPNIPDMKGITPIYCAANQGLENILKLILDYSKQPLDIDTYTDRRQKTARMIIKSTFPHLLDRFKAEGEIEAVIDANLLFSYLSRGDEESFVRDFNKLKKNEQNSVLIQNNGFYTILQLCCDRGFETAVTTLLKAGADPNLTAPGNSTRSIELACANGHASVLQILADHDSILIDNNNEQSLLQIVAREMKKGVIYTKADFKECLEILLNHPKMNINVNFGDFKDNTALHYAARNGDTETVLTLLRNGACIGLRNKYNEPPLADIPAETLETYLDECVESNSERPSDEDYEIHIEYSFLVYPNNSLENEACKMPLMDNSNDNVPAYELLAPETDALMYMTRSQELRPLLKHPVITSFLYLKWQRISGLFYGNLSFYSLLWLSLIIYILQGYGKEPKNSESVPALVTISFIGSVVGLFVLIAREAFQLAVSPRRYSQNVENWLEITLIIVTSKILSDITVPEHIKQQLSAVAILLSSAELVLLIGQFPGQSTNIVMLKTVSWNFFKFLIWYCIIIIAFALSFYTLFRKTTEKKNDEYVPPNANTSLNVSSLNIFNDISHMTEEENKNQFLDPGTALFKTIVMLTGELDASSIEFDTATGHIIFIVFVFMVPIVLFNLLNGLAVSDTQRIKEDAELIGHISMIQLISYFESFLLGSMRSYRNVFDSPKNRCCWMPNTTFLSSCLFCLRPLARRICLFPNFLPKQTIVVKPNQANRIEIPKNETKPIWVDYEDVESGNCFLRRCQMLQLERNIVKDAKLVIYNKTHHSELDEIRDRLIQYEKKIDNLERTIKNFIHTCQSRA